MLLALSNRFSLLSRVNVAPETRKMKIRPYILSVALFASILCLNNDSSAGGDITETVNGVTFVRKVVPSGEFMMGCGLADELCLDEEWADRTQGVRQGRVSVESFFLAETETTWDLYQLCIDNGTCADNSGDGEDNGWGKSSRPEFLGKRGITTTPQRTPPKRCCIDWRGRLYCFERSETPAAPLSARPLDSASSSNHPLCRTDNALTEI